MCSSDLIDLASAFHSGKRTSQAREPGESEKFSTLRSLKFFTGFNDAELWEVMRMASWESAAAGHALMHEGEPGNFFCILASGEARVSKNNRLLNVLGSGDCLGEMSYLAGVGKRRGADVRIEKPSRLIRIRNADLDQASDACRHRFDRAFLHLLVERLALSNERLSSG